jgi:hypothetical protein
VIYTALTLLLNDSDDPDGLWDDYQTNDNPQDLWNDAGGVISSSAILEVYSRPLTQAEIYYTRDFFSALSGLDSTSRDNMIADFTGDGVLIISNTSANGPLEPFLTHKAYDGSLSIHFK